MMFSPVVAAVVRGSAFDQDLQVSEDPMTKDEITARIADCEAELAEVRADIINGAQEGQPASLAVRRAELTKEIVALKALLDESA